MSLRTRVEKLYLEVEKDRNFHHQLELLKTPKLLDSVKFLIRLIDAMEADSYNFEPSSYFAQLKLLLSDNWLGDPVLQKFSKKALIDEIKLPRAKKVLFTDKRLVKHMIEAVENIKKMCEDGDTGKPLKEFAPGDMEKIQTHAERIKQEFWWFYRAANLFESYKIMLRATSEHDEFWKKPEEFMKKMGGVMDKPVRGMVEY